MSTATKRHYKNLIDQTKKIKTGSLVKVLYHTRPPGLVIDCTYIKNGVNPKLKKWQKLVSFSNQLKLAFTGEYCLILDSNNKILIAHSANLIFVQ